MKGLTPFENLIHKNLNHHKYPSLPMDQTYYFDADVIIAYFDEDDREKNRVSKNTVGRAKNNVRMNPCIKVKIPSIAMDEIFLWLIEKC